MIFGLIAQNNIFIYYRLSLLNRFLFALLTDFYSGVILAVDAEANHRRFVFCGLTAPGHL